MQALAIPRSLVVLNLLAALQFALFVGFFPFAIILTPYGDILDWLTQYYTFADQSLWQFLWKPHNGHPIVFTKLLTIGDAELLGGLSYPVALVCISMWLMVTALAIIGVRRSVMHSQTRSWVTAVMVLLLFPTSIFSNFAYPVNSAFVIVSFFVFIACLLLAHTAVLKAEHGSGIRVFFVTSLIAAGCASVSSMNGLIVWPILMWIAWSLNLERNNLVAIGAMAVVFALLFGFSQSGPAEDFSSIFTIGDILQILRYLAEFHGMPWTEVGPLYWPSTILGATIFLLGIVFSLRGILASRALAPHDVVATAMLLFALGTAVMIAIGRYKMGLLPAHRYGIFLQIIYVSLLVINIRLLRKICGSFPVPVTPQVRDTRRFQRHDTF